MNLNSRVLVATFVKKNNVPQNIAIVFGNSLYLCSVEG